MSMAWFFLLLAGFFEICFTVALKYTQGFSKLIPSLITAAFASLSFFCMSQSMKVIPIGTAYAIWAGIGTAGTVICGIIFFQESYHIVKSSRLHLLLLVL